MFHTPKFDVLAKAVFDEVREWKIENGFVGTDKQPEICIYVDYEYHRQVLAEISSCKRDVSPEAWSYIHNGSFLGCDIWPVIPNHAHKQPPKFNICIKGEQGS